MKRLSKDGMQVLQFEEDAFSKSIHGIFSRHGGISKYPWSSLNQGGTVGDVRDNVIENRRRAFQFFDRKVESIFDVWQVHGTVSICSSKPRGLDEPHQQADAIFTNNPDLTLFMRFADCVPIMIIDPIKKVVGIIHAGWKGTVTDIVSHAITEIIKVYDVNPGDLVAGIGPSIGPDHYLVGEEVIAAVEKTFGEYSKELLDYSNGEMHFNLWLANEYLLKKNGLKRVESARICTACHTEDWYSHRAENGSTGRFGAMIAIKK
jgi:polyphenol oxidase